MERRLRSDLIRDYLKREGRKQSWVANQIGISQTLFVKMMRGHVPKQDALSDLAKLIGVSTSELLAKRNDVA